MVHFAKIAFISPCKQRAENAQKRHTLTPQKLVAPVSSGDASGRALRTARQPVVSKVVQRRVNYEGALIAAQQMAIAIGGWRGYGEYRGFNLDSYAKGDLNHTVADRPVFAEDPLDRTEVDTAFWNAASAARKAGASLEGYLSDLGWDDERITLIIGVDEQPDEQPDDENLPDL